MVGRAVLINDRPVLAGQLARRSNRHRDADGRAVLLIHPRVIGDRKDQAQPVLGVQMLCDDAPAEHLGDRIGGDKTEAPRRAAPDRKGSAVPPMHHEISALRDVGRGEQCFEIAIAQSLSHVLTADERRVPDDKVCTRPYRGAYAFVAIDWNACRLVRYRAAGDGMGAHRLTVPAGDRLVVRINLWHARIPGDQRISMLDGTHVA